MHRRGLLALLVGGASAGCLTEYAPSGPRNPPEGDDSRPDQGPNTGDVGLSVIEWDFFEGADDELIVEVVVGNDADVERTGTLSVTVTVAGDEVVRSEDVQVPPGDEETVELDTDVDFEEFAADGSIDLDLS